MDANGIEDGSRVGEELDQQAVHGSDESQLRMVI
jgi:hypothetical protein